MKHLLLPIIITILLHSCTNKPHSENFSASENKTASSKNIYTNTGESSFTITSGDTSNDGYDYETVEVNYKTDYIALDGDRDFKHYFAKYTTTTKSCTACEQPERNIKVELNAFDDPKKTALTIQQDCDDLTLDAHTYKTAKYGCCGAEDHLAVYDYNNKLIIEGESEILVGDIPNSPVKIFVAYEVEQKDSTVLGTLYFCYNSSDRYAIVLKSDSLPASSCPRFVPDFSIDSRNTRDGFNPEKKEYTLWSLDAIKDKKQVNNLDLKIIYPCDYMSGNNVILIPIINGKPFGKDDRNQEITFQ